MIFFDVNALIYAHRAELPQHKAAFKLVTRTLEAEEPFGLSDLVLSSVVRITTHHRTFDPPSSMEEAVGFCEVLRNSPWRVAVEPGHRHWDIFLELCRLPGVKGALVTDAWLAALAIENGCELVTADGDFKRFAPRLKLRGLMFMPLPDLTDAALRAEFGRVRRIFQELRGRGHDIDTLSMGMSDDLEIAVEEGSTMVRVGTALFGARAG